MKNMSSLRALPWPGTSRHFEKKQNKTLESIGGCETTRKVKSWGRILKVATTS
jgi:hypothetical protein